MLRRGEAQVERAGARLGRRRALAVLAGVALLAGCRREPRYSQPEAGFLRLDADEVLAAFRAAGLPVGEVRPRPIATATPNPDLPYIPKVRAGGAAGEPMVEVDARNFAIPGHAAGGRVFVFDSAERLRAKRIWFARFPDLYPYVYPHENVLVWLDPTLTPAEADRYRQAIEALAP